MGFYQAPIADMDEPHIVTWQRPGTPDPRTPTSIISAKYATNNTVFSSMGTGTTTLTVPDDLEEENGIVKTIAVKNPFMRENPFLPTNPFAPASYPPEEHVDTDDSLFGGYTGSEYSSSDDDAKMEDDENQASKEQQDDASYAESTEDEDMSDEDSAISEIDEELAEDEVIETVAEKVTSRAVKDVVPRTGRIVKVPKVSFKRKVVQKVIKEVHENSEDEVDEGTAEGSVGDDGDTIMTNLNPDDQDIEDEQTTITEYDTSSNWDGYEVVQDKLDGYESVKQSIKGQEKWTEAQAKLHKLLALRGAWPMFDRTWTYHFKDREIYPWVYAPEQNKKRVAITAKSHDFKAAKALETLFDLSPLVCSYRQTGLERKIGGLIRKTLERYIYWAVKDADVADRSFIDTMLVHEFDFVAYAAGVRSRTLIKKEKGLDTEFGSSTGEETGAQDTREVDGNPISDEIEIRLRGLAAKHRAALVNPEYKHLPEFMWTYKEQPPIVYGFMILQHMVMVVNLDSSSPDNDLVVYAELDMSLADQWLWNALALALPVHMARDDLWEKRDRLPMLEVTEIDDPDA